MGLIGGERPLPISAAYDARAVEAIICRLKTRHLPPRQFRRFRW